MPLPSSREKQASQAHLNASVQGENWLTESLVGTRKEKQEVTSRLGLRRMSTWKVLLSPLQTMSPTTTMSVRIKTTSSWS